VARLAGLPETVISRAREVLTQLEAGHPPAESVGTVPTPTSVPARPPKVKVAKPGHADQLTLFA
jgi:DNA mismatch repair protein MutS